jgi:meso-butanediol dehydrogenase / (S,S)-butanediol dehydrogenase / diacetyl reductase
MGAVTARRFRDEGAAVVLTGRTREKLTKVVSQFDQERRLIHVSDVTEPDEQESVRASNDESAR